MKDGFIKCAAAGVKIQVADPQHNAQEVIQRLDECMEHGAKVIVFPELVLSGYTCQDLFYQESLLSDCKKALVEIIAHSKMLDAIIFVGFPFSWNGNLYNAAAVLKQGELLGIVPKSELPSHGEFCEGRYFTKGPRQVTQVTFDRWTVPFGCDQLFVTESGWCIGCEICEDLWAPISMSTYHALAGANLIVNLSASNELVGKAAYRRKLVGTASAKLICGYVFASAGEGESTQDIVFGGSHLIAENGKLLAEAAPFANAVIYSEIDGKRIAADRRRSTTFSVDMTANYTRTVFAWQEEETALSRKFARLPFVPADVVTRRKRCEEIFAIQANGLKKRLEHTHCQTAVIGVSGGLDSTLAMLVTAKAFDLLSMDRKNIRAVTMPCFGTTDRTYENACLLAKLLGCSLREIDIKKSVIQHFEDIGQKLEQHDVTYENAQARERTQVLMDIANQCGGMVIGTGDLSELALGWATYNGDHMSMYGVNADIPKTLVRHLVAYYAEECCDSNVEAGNEGKRSLKEVLLDVLDTPVSPELLPPVDGVIAQKTEDLVGPYELHDFFLYYVLRHGVSPKKLYRLAKYTFTGEYEEETILKWMKKFYYRYFSQQFKRSCLPDGPKVGSVGVSPRGDLHMPSDASVAAWIREIESL